MSVARVTEIISSSKKSFEDAIQSGLARAEKTLRNVRWFEVVETRGNVQGGRVAHYQVRLKVPKI